MSLLRGTHQINNLAPANKNEKHEKYPPTQPRKGSLQSIFQYKQANPSQTGWVLN